MHTSIKIHYLKNNVLSQAFVFRLQFKSVSTCFWVELKHIGETCGDSYLIGLTTQKKSNTLDKSSQPPVDQQRDMPFYIYKYTHIYLLCKIFHSWGLKRQHSSHLSAVPSSSVHCPVHSVFVETSHGCSVCQSSPSNCCAFGPNVWPCKLHKFVNKDGPCSYWTNKWAIKWTASNWGLRYDCV